MNALNITSPTQPAWGYDVRKKETTEILVQQLGHFISVQLLSCVWLFASPWTAAHQASLC